MSLMEETYQIKMIRAGYVEQKMREGYTYDEAMKMFDEVKAGRPREKHVHRR